MSNSINTVAIVGAGTMGRGITQAVALAGYKVILYDVNDAILNSAYAKIISNLDKGIELGKITEQQKQAAIKNIELTHEIIKVAADLIIEAVVEDLRIKLDLFSKLESINRDSTIFATNTSSFSVTAIGSALKMSNRLAGLHFFNPAHIMKLVEIVSGNETDTNVIESLKEFARSIGKVSVSATDAPGFIVNRVARHYYLESLCILKEQVADHQTIDELLEAYGFKMGPFRLMDLIGIDTNLAVTQSIFESFHFEPRFRPNSIQEQMVAAGHYGRKSGKGFYSYE